MIDIGILEVFLLGDGKHLIAVGGGQELSLLIEKLEGVPLTRIVRGCDDNTTCCPTHGDSELGGRSSSQTYVEHIITHAHQGTTYYILDHLARDAGIAAHYDSIA